jgi:hypothetical protein
MANVMGENDPPPPFDGALVGGAGVFVAGGAVVAGGGTSGALVGADVGGLVGLTAFSAAFTVAAMSVDSALVSGVATVPPGVKLQAASHKDKPNSIDNEVLFFMIPSNP